MSITSTKNRISEVLFLIVYILLVHGTSALNDFFVEPYFEQHVSYYPIFGSVYKLLFWLVPAFLYIRYVEKQEPITYLKLNTNVGKGLLWAFIVALFFFVEPSYIHFVQGQGWHLHLRVDQWINVVVLVGFTEEIPYRGILFQKFQQWMGFWWGSMLSSLLFLALHIPYWISIGETLFPNMLYTMVYIFVFGFLMCFVLKRSGSLWSCIIIHSVNDLVSLIN